MTVQIKFLFKHGKSQQVTVYETHNSIKRRIVKFSALYYTNLKVYFKMFDQNKVFNTYIHSSKCIHCSFLIEEHKVSEL